MNDDVLFRVLSDDEVIAQYRYRAVSELKTMFEGEVTELTLEDGSSASEHFAAKRPSFELKLLCYNPVTPKEDEPETRLQQYGILYDLWANRWLFNLVTDFGTFENLIITAIEARETLDSSNTFEVNLSLKKVQYVLAEPTEFQYITDKDGKKISNFDRQGTEVIVNLDKPVKKKDEDPGIIKQFYNYVNEHRPGWIYDKNTGEWKAPILSGIKDFLW